MAHVHGMLHQALVLWLCHLAAMLTATLTATLAAALAGCRPRDITWHESNWDNPDSRFLAWTLHDTASSGAGDVFVAFNAHGFEVPAALPPPPAGRKWARLVDTNLPPPRDFTPGGNAGVEGRYGVAPHSAIVLVSKPA